MTADAPNINHFWARLIIEELVRNGIDFFCISPGSRSTPLTTAAARHPRARHVVHLDERGSAFFATGYARATGKPAVWITTSGTAVANGLPAAAEAWSDHLPLILLTADRPPELRATGANQTIDQVKIFGDYVKEFFDLPAPDPSIDPALVLTTVDQLIHQARSRPAGPVHLNCMFRKPLAPEKQSYTTPPLKAQLRRWTDREEPYTAYSFTSLHADVSTVEEMAARVKAAERGLLVAGRLHSRKRGRAVADLAEQLQWPLLTDIGSQIRLTNSSSTAVPYFDRLLSRVDERADYQPDTVLQFGGRCTSKRLRQFLEEHPPEHHVVVKEHPRRFDIHHTMTDSIEADVVEFTRSLSAAAPTQTPDSWLQMWCTGSERIQSTLDAYADGSDALREPRICRLLTRHIPRNHGLFLASSRPVRDADMYGDVLDHAVPVAANRGASGIDGTVASAAGFARGLGRPVTLLAGDLALLHDLNALAIVRDAPQPIVIVAVNNNGGGIFSFLPIADHPDVFEEFFATPFNVTFERAAQMFEIPYFRPTTSNGFSSDYREAASSGTSALIEVQTDRETNRQEHREIEQMIDDALSNKG